jgi:acetolactate synthase-1/3 small subunit
LSRVCGLFSRRGFNIDSLAVGVTDDDKISRITIVANGNEHTMEQIQRQLPKLHEVKKVKIYEHNDIISRELMMLKIAVTAEKRAEIMTLADIMDAKIVDLTFTTMTLEICNTFFHVNRFVELMQGYEILEMVRTGTVAIEKGSESLK